MAAIKVLAGDFLKHGLGALHGGTLVLTPRDTKLGRAKSYSVKDLKALELADEQSGVRAFGAAAWGTAGALVAGPLGLLAGAVLGGQGQKVTFVAVTADDKRLLGQCDKSAWIKMQACRF